MSKKPPLIFHGWLIVAVGIVSYAVGYGARYSFAVVFPYLLEEFRWPRDTTAGMLTVHMIVYGIVAPFAGRLVEGLGPRRTMVTGTVLLSLGLACSSRGSEPWHFYLGFGLLCGTGLCLVGAVPFVTVLRNWFETKRGWAFSLLYLGSGGAFVWYPVLALLIESRGWRQAFVAAAVVVSTALIPLFVLLIRYHPADKGLTRDGIPEVHEEPLDGKAQRLKVVDQEWASVDWTLPKAIRTRRFWLVCLSTFSMWGIMQHIMVAHHVAFAADVGYSKLYASSVLSLYGVSFLAGSLSGFISDRIGREWTLTIGTLIGSSGILILTLIMDASQPWMLYYYAAAFGFGAGISAPAITAAITDIFQGPNVGVTIGAVWLSFAIGGAIGPWLGGWIFELTHEYQVAFLLAIVWYGVACVAVWAAAPRKVRLVAGRINRNDT
jgi:MFS family permease